MSELIGRYKIVIRAVPEEDGGGFHIFAPTLGEMTVYGVGDTLDEAITGLLDAYDGVCEILAEDGARLPEPTREDDEWCMNAEAAQELYERAARNNYAFAA